MFKNKDIHESPEFFEHAAEQGYITLKEAAELSSYSPDYVGQLIRAGKIEGKQVYSNIAWVTTEESLRAYMEQRAPVGEHGSTQQSRGKSFNDVVLYIVIGVLAVLLLFFFYIMSVGVDRALLTTDEDQSVESFTYE